LEAYESVEAALAQQMQQREETNAIEGNHVNDDVADIELVGVTHTPGRTSQGVTRSLANSSNTVKGQQQQPTAQPAAEFSDEFDDDDDDDADLMNEMLDLAAKYDSQLPVATNENLLVQDTDTFQDTQQRAKPPRLGTLDEFEDAFDDDDDLWDDIADATAAKAAANVGSASNV
jgi:hypothetical protein